MQKGQIKFSAQINKTARWKWPNYTLEGMKQFTSHTMYSVPERVVFNIRDSCAFFLHLEWQSFYLN